MSLDIALFVFRKYAQEDQIYEFSDLLRDTTSAAGLAASAVNAPRFIDSARSFNLARKDLRDGAVSGYDMLSSYRPQVGDVIMHSSSSELSPTAKLQKKLVNAVGGVKDHHAYTVIGQPGGGMVVVPVGMNSKRYSPIYDRLSAALNTLESSSKPALTDEVTGKVIRPAMVDLNNIRDTWQRLREHYDKSLRTINKSKDRLARQPAISLDDLFSTQGSPLSLMYGPQASGVARVLRPVNPLTSAEESRLLLNAEKYMQQGSGKAEMIVAGLKNMLFGKGKYVPGERALTCAGGVCNAFEGIRDIGNATQALPSDVAASPHFKQLARVASEDVMPHLKDIDSRAVSAAKKILAARGLVFGAPLALAGALQLPRLLSSEPSKEAVVNSSLASGDVDYDPLLGTAGVFSGLAGVTGLRRASSLEGNIAALRQSFPDTLRRAVEHSNTFANSLLPAIDAQSSGEAMWRGYMDNPDTFKRSPAYGASSRMFDSDLTPAEGAKKYVKTTWEEFKKRLDALTAARDNAKQAPRTLKSSYRSTMRQLAIRRALARTLGYGGVLAGATGLAAAMYGVDPTTVDNHNQAV